MNGLQLGKTGKERQNKKKLCESGDLEKMVRGRRKEKTKGEEGRSTDWRTKQGVNTG